MSVATTTCEVCVFAVFNDGRQVGCEFNRIRPLARNGANIVEKTSDAGTHYEMDRFCNAVRNEEWADMQEDRSPSGLRIAAYEEFKFKPHAILYAGPDSTTAQIDDSIASLVDQDPPIAHFTICFYREYERAGEWAVNLATDNPFECTWNVIQGEDPTPEMIAHYGEDPYLRLVDEAVYQSKQTFYTAGRAGFIWPKDYFEKFDTAINMEMRRLVGVLPAPNSDGGFIIAKNFHLVAGENRAKPVFEKLVECAREEETSHVVGRYEDFA